MGIYVILQKLVKARELYEPGNLKLELDSTSYTSSSSSSSTRLKSSRIEYFSSRSRVSHELSRLVYTPTEPTQRVRLQKGLKAINKLHNKLN